MRRAAVLVLVVLFIAFGLVYLAPLPDTQVAARLAPLLDPRRGQSVAIAGNSVLMHVSACDEDKRPLHTILAADLGRRVDNLGFDGQPFEQSLNYVTTALRRKSVSGAVLFVAPFSLTVRTLPDIQTELFLRFAASGQFHANSLVDRIRMHDFVSPVPSENTQPFTYNHIQYPDYNGIKQIYFNPEKAAMGCPETLGENRRFIEAVYWHTYLSHPVRQNDLADLSVLQRIAKHLNKPLVIVLLPVDYSDIRSLNPALSENVRARVDSIVSDMRRLNVNVLDLTGSLPADDFADRWSASGHLVQEGRHRVAERVVAAFQSVAPSIPSQPQPGRN